MKSRRPSRPSTDAPSLADAFVTSQHKQQYVRRLFATIAGRYDLITVVLSFGRDRAWKTRLIALAQPASSSRVLDLATGTGDLAYLSQPRAGAVVGLDVTQEMIVLARAKADARRAPSFLVGDMTMLPFVSGSFDIVTTGYGLRNVPDLERSIAEAARVLRPGGRFLSLDFNRPANAVVRSLYLFYLWLVGGVTGWLLHRDADTYRYIPASIRRYPGAENVTQLLRDHGFRRARWHRVLGGLMAIHEAEK